MVAVLAEGKRKGSEGCWFWQRPRWSVIVRMEGSALVEEDGLSFCVLLSMGYGDELREARLLGFQAKEKW
ncbi:hypothetical protein D5086_023392 [Populus alba]|uniref:Uncharacterized protein n=1 Tax=Populus alba TaxID=43335 RepID=A0ACC4BAB5_POPAL